MPGKIGLEVMQGKSTRPLLALICSHMCISKRWSLNHCLVLNALGNAEFRFTPGPRELMAHKEFSAARCVRSFKERLQVSSFHPFLTLWTRTHEGEEDGGHLRSSQVLVARCASINRVQVSALNAFDSLDQDA